MSAGKVNFPLFNPNLNNEELNTAFKRAAQGLKQASILLGIVLVLIFALGLISGFFLFKVHQTERVILKQFGRVQRVVSAPGLHVKSPLQTVSRQPRNIVEYDAKPAEVYTKDGKIVILDNFAVWQITDPVRFDATVKDINGAQQQIDDVLYGELRNRFGELTFTEVIAQGRDDIRVGVLRTANEKLPKNYGVRLLDTRIKRNDLPDENMQSIFQRMTTGREKVAAQYVSEGEREATMIRAEADKYQAIAVSEAQKKAALMRGEADAYATAAYGRLGRQDPEFFSFMRSLDAYRASFKEGDKLILSPGSKFLKFFN